MKNYYNSMRTSWISKGRLLFAMLVMLFACQNISAQVDVTASGGTLSASYTTLSSAFTAINTGTHQGAIEINLSSSFTDVATSVLNSNGAGAALYTSVIIRPSADAVVMSFPSVTGRGVIELNGADNVTIDGDNPNSGGTNRNLTITNTAVNTVTYTSVIRIALSTLVTTGDNNIVRNCVLNGNATGRNIAAATSTTGTENTTYGVLVGGGASTTVATNAPSAITSVSTVVGSPITATAFTADNNVIDACARGISVNGSAITVVPNLVVNNNLIGSATAGNTTTVYSRGISLQGYTNAIISGNIVRNMGWFVSSSLQGIVLGDVSTSGANAIIQNNIVQDLNNQSPLTYGAFGIHLNGGNSHIVRNNYVSGITGDMTGGGAFGTTFGLLGIRIASGTGHGIYYNTVSLSGLRAGTANSSLLAAALAIVATTQTGCDVRNNILSNTMSGGTTGLAYVSLYLPSGGTSAMNLTLNNNVYYCGSTSTSQGIAQVSATSSVANLYLASNFIPGATAPATNLRSYSSTLSAAGTNDNLSTASTVAAPFVSSTDLHIDINAANIADSDAKAAVISGITTDFDGNTRNATTPDIGADEFTPPVSPGVLQLSSATYAGNEGTSLVVTVNRSGGSTGAVGVTYSLTDGTATGAMACGVGFDYVNAGAQTLSFADGEVSKTFTVSLCSDLVFDVNETFTATLSSPTGGATLGSVANATVTIGDVAPPFNGTYTVGTAGNYPSLTNTGGIFEAINLSGAVGNVTINIISDLTGETGTHALNEIAGGFTTLIQPSGAARIVTGSNIGALIKLNGADNVTINGSTTGASVLICAVGGNDALRELTFQNTNVGTSAGVISVQSGVNGASNNSIKNIKVFGQDPTTTLIGIALGGNTLGSTGTDNDNNIVENCLVQKALFGIYSAGLSLANQNSGTILRNNNLSALGADRIRRIGILMFNENSANVSFNSVGGIDNTGESADAIGIAIGTQDVSGTTTTSGSISNTTVSNNKVNGVSNDATYSAAGIAVSGGIGGANTIMNNMISDVISDGNSGDISVGLFVVGATGSDTRLYNNTVSMTGDRSALLTPGTTQHPSYAIAFTGVDPTVDLRNNILTTSQFADLVANPNAKSYAIGMVTTTFANLNSNYNDFVSTGIQDGGFRSGSLGTAAGTDYASLALWGAAITDDANSVEIAPDFTSPTDLHLNTINNPTLDNLGTVIAAVTNDFDCEARSATTPDMGADEFTTLSVNQFDLVNGFNAYPNPVSSILNIEYTSDLKSVSVFNMLGQQVLTKNVSATSTQIDMSALTNGTYLVKVEAGSVSKTIKVFKK